MNEPATGARPARSDRREQQHQRFHASLAGTVLAWRTLHGNNKHQGRGVVGADGTLGVGEIEPLGAGRQGQLQQGRDHLRQANAIVQHVGLEPEVTSLVSDIRAFEPVVSGTA